MRNFEVAMVFILFFGVVFSTFFFWTRLARRPREDGLTADSWFQGFVGSILACLLFAICFAIGVWFSISRLKGDGWNLSA